MTARLRRIYPFLLTGAGITAAAIPAPPVPENLKAPATETVFLKALGKGRQIYLCQALPGNATKFDWVLEKPQADLLNAQGQRIGRHFEGPTWEAADGSKVVGEVQQRAPAPHAGAVPWLLLKARSHQGAGTFAGVTYIQRVDTVGGGAPVGGCDQFHAGKETAIEYQADYYFYTARR